MNEDARVEGHDVDFAWQTESQSPSRVIDAVSAIYYVFCAVGATFLLGTTLSLFGCVQ